MARKLFTALAVCAVAAAAFSGCAPAPAERSAPHDRPAPAARGSERPGPDGPWRPHLLSRCGALAEQEPSAAARRALDQCRELFGFNEGGDAIMALELYLRGAEDPDPLVLITLGQLYLMAGQGVPQLVPNEGPAADTGNWERNRTRFLARARRLLGMAGAKRGDDSVVDYLLADVARAGGDPEEAAELVASGLGKCTIPASMDILTRYQELLPSPAEQTGGPVPEYPAELSAKGIGGDVVQDLLVAPDGGVAQVETVSRVDGRLERAAAAACGRAEFRPARIGKYPVWSWVRVTTRFDPGGRG